MQQPTYFKRPWLKEYDHRYIRVERSDCLIQIKRARRFFLRISYHVLTSDNYMMNELHNVIKKTQQ